MPKETKNSAAIKEMQAAIRALREQDKADREAARAALSPREYCASRRVSAFRKQQRAIDGQPRWKKATKGLMAVTDGTGRDYVAYGLMFGVELQEDGTPAIASYWFSNAPTEGLAARIPHTLGSCRTSIQLGNVSVLKMPITYQDMVRSVREVYPRAWVPDEATFLLEYGLRPENGQYVKLARKA